METGVRRFAQQCKAEHDEVVALGGCTSWAPSATKLGASITSFAGVPAPGRPGSSRFFLSLEDD